MFSLPQYVHMNNPPLKYLKAIMDRLYKTVVDKVERSPPLKRALFDFVYELKRSKIDTGYDTPFLNR